MRREQLASPADMDYQAEQEMEVEALESILMDDFEGTPASYVKPVCLSKGVLQWSAATLCLHNT